MATAPVAAAMITRTSLLGPPMWASPIVNIDEAGLAHGDDKLRCIRPQGDRVPDEEQAEKRHQLRQQRQRPDRGEDGVLDLEVRRTSAEMATMTRPRGTRHDAADAWNGDRPRGVTRVDTMLAHVAGDDDETDEDSQRCHAASLAWSERRSGALPVPIQSATDLD